MTVDAARQHQTARGIHNFGGRAEIAAERRNAAAGDADVAGESVGRGRHRSAADDRVECHQCLTCVFLLMREIPAIARR
jgi:hypothetical protein